MEGAMSTRQTQSGTRALLNRTSGSNAISTVHSTLGLWRQVPELKDEGPKCQSGLTQCEQNERRRPLSSLWNVQRRNSPHLPLMVSPFNLLRTLMPLYWNSIATRKPSQKAGWNFYQALSLIRPSHLKAMRCGWQAPFVKGGSLREYGTIAGSAARTLLKRLLLIRHWASSAYSTQPRRVCTRMAMTWSMQQCTTTTKTGRWSKQHCTAMTKIGRWSMRP
ncbi:hypothetical protein B0H12DRAFT_808529 [Mycena haematopus]|nr:hypothetical protein B0H12DRAFT_808529 [Mycena haematopus]